MKNKSIIRYYTNTNKIILPEFAITNEQSNLNSEYYTRIVIPDVI